jgi:hypothetical protein
MNWRVQFAPEALAQLQALEQRLPPKDTSILSWTSA